MDPPRLPWQVIQRVIDHSGGHANTLRSLSLACHRLRPHSCCVMFARVRFKGRDHVFAFLDFLQDNPHLKPVVRSIVVRPTDLAPSPLLRILPSLSDIEFAPHLAEPPRSSSRNIFPALHQSSLTCFRQFGTHINTLRLSRLSFATYLSLARVLLTFTSITHLYCSRVEIATAGNRANLNVLKRRLQYLSKCD
ncbi:hypothetical protein LXA43DRAFT_896224 [Ganoderma leucocontextum]|nr:hypothetical protein LXA43DRAFT_896224 [Ganoderma leucocontextum]